MPGIRRALILTSAERYFTLVVNFLTIAIASRLLTPEEIGVSVVGTSIAALAFSMQEFATASFLIQQHNLTREDIRGAFTVMLLLKVLISAGIAFLAPAAASIYGEKGLALYLQVVACSCLLEAISMPIVALLKRDMQFQKVAIINATGAILLATCTIAFVKLGFSYLSFAWAGLLSTSFCGMLALILRPDFWIYRPLLRRWRAMLTFGGYNGVSVLLYRLYEMLPYVILGRILALDAAAVYNRALMICQVPDKIILGGTVSVILPALAQEVHAGRDLRSPYLRSIEYITGLQWPALLFLAVMAEPVVQIILGAQWHATIPLVQIIAVSSLFSFSAVLNYPVLVALNAMRDASKRALIVWPLSALTITAAAFMGLEAVAWSFLIIMPLQACVSFAFIRRHLAITWSDLLSALRKSAIVAGSSVLGAAATLPLNDVHQIQHPMLLALFAGIFSGIGWLLGVWLTRHPILGELVSLAGVIRLIRAPRVRST